MDSFKAINENDELVYLFYGDSKQLKPGAVCRDENDEEYIIESYGSGLGPCKIHVCRLLEYRKRILILNLNGPCSVKEIEGYLLDMGLKIVKA